MTDIDPKLIYATAKVIVTLEVDAASWDVGSPALQIFNAAGREAVNLIDIMIQEYNLKHNRVGIRIIGQPEVTTVFGKRTK